MTMWVFQNQASEINKEEPSNDFWVDGRAAVWENPSLARWPMMGKSVRGHSNKQPWTSHSTGARRVKFIVVSSTVQSRWPPGFRALCSFARSWIYQLRNRLAGKFAFDSAVVQMVFEDQTNVRKLRNDRVQRAKPFQCLQAAQLAGTT